MWPWEHVLVAYVCYSAYAHLWYRHSPRDAAVLVLPLAAVLPDLIDKPLAWQLSVLPAGRSLAHSLLFAVPVVLFVLALARWWGNTEVGVAFGIGYLSHLPADAVYPAIMPGEKVDLGYLIWPIASGPTSGTDDLLAHVVELAADFATFATGPGGWRFLVLEGVLGGMALALWIADGWPGLRLLWRAVRPRAKA